ncbi:MAG: MJ1255/VC2487 family glycosyltransferase [Planctomycetota bacterium]|jgi:uncharacterized protein (TIGR00661 family)
MAKIIYAVAGEGFGHSSRAHVIAERLIDSGHKLMFAASQKSLAYLKQYFGENVKQVLGLSFAYDKGYVQPLVTLKRNLKKIPELKSINKKLFQQHFLPFKPDLVISDFEPFSAWWAWKNKVPYISIDHEHIVTLCKLEHKMRNIFSRITANVVTRFYYTGAQVYIVLNFFDVPLKIKSAVLAPPIVRNELTKLTPTDGKHILVYSTTGVGKKELLDLLQKFDNQNFCVYGFNKDEKIKNCQLKTRSTEGFLADLGECKGIIASAGFSLISECMYLKKKILALPLAGQYEQITNAHYIEKLGLGVSANKLDKDVLQRFLNELDKPTPEDERIIWPNNERFFEIMQKALNQLPNPINIKMN